VGGLNVEIQMFVLMVSSRRMSFVKMMAFYQCACVCVTDKAQVTVDGEDQPRQRRIAERNARRYNFKRII